MDITAIKDRLKLSSVIEKDTDLKPAGTDKWRARCPIHGSDKQKSLAVDDGVGRYHCFSCAASGDVLQWLQDVRGLEFKDALAEAAKLAGVEETVEVSKADKKRRRIAELIDQAARYYHKCLNDTLRAGMRGKWHFTDETIDHCLIGFANGTLKRELDAPSQSLLIESGLFTKTPGGVTETLQGRFVFPWLRNKRAVYMVGRRLDDSKTSIEKYYNLRVTTNVKKPLWGGDSLAGADGILVVEGIRDAILAWQYRDKLTGNWAIVTPASHTLRAEDAVLIARYGPDIEIVLVPDVDDPGVNGSIRSGQLLVEQGIQDIYVAELSEPDLADYLSKSLDEWPELISRVRNPEAKAYYTPFWRFWGRQLHRATEAKRSSAITKAVIPALYRLDLTHRNAAMPIMAEELGVNEHTFAQQVKTYEEEPETADLATIDSWFKEHFVVLGHHRTETDSKLVVWSKQYRRTLKLGIDRPRVLANQVAPDLGDLDTKLKELVPWAEKSHQRIQAFLATIAYMTEGSVSMSSVTRMRNGLHLAGDELILISGSRILSKANGGWQRLDDPVHGDYLLEALPEPPDWCTWTAEELTEPPRYDPAQIYHWLEEALLRGWTWTHPEDVQLMALVPFALTWATLFPNRPLIHLLSAAVTGKSVLGAGFYGGADIWAGCGGPMIPTAGTEEKTTMAGVIGKYSHTTQCLIMDEADPSDGRVQEILDVLRNSGTYGTGVLRGTAEGGFREAFLNVPAIFMGTEDWSKDPDTTRWTTIELWREPKHQAPDHLLTEYWAGLDVDLDELRRCILIAFSENYREVIETYERLKTPGTITDDGKITSRQRLNLLPFFTVASVIGLDMDVLGKTIIGVRAGYEDQVEAGRIERRLQAVLLSSPIRLGPNNTVTGSQLSEEGGMASQTAPHGIAYKDGLLYVNWAAAQSDGPLKGTPFQGIDPRNLNRIARDIPGVRENSVDKSIAGVRARWIVFDYEKLAGAPPDQGSFSSDGDPNPYFGE